MRSVTTVGGVVALLCGAVAFAACGNGPNDLPDGNLHTSADARFDAGIDTVIDAQLSADAPPMADAHVMLDAPTTADAIVIDATHFDAGIDASPNELQASWAPEFANLVGYWTLDGIVGDQLTQNTDIVAVVGNDGSAYSSAEQMNYVASPLHGALSFDAQHTVGVIPSGTIQNDFTVQAWVFFSSADSYSGSIFGTRGPSDNSFDFKLNSSDQVHGDLGNGDTFFNTGLDANDDFAIGVWHQIVYSVSSTNYTIYHNGVAIGTGLTMGTPLLYDANHQIAIGDSNIGGSEQFGGAIDEIAIWNVALSASDVATLYATESTGMEITSDWAPQFSSVVGYWTFDDAAGPAADNSAVPAVIGAMGTLAFTSGETPGPAMTYVSGQVNQAVNCPADSSVISIYPTDALTSAFTVSVWVNPDDNSLNNTSLVGTQSSSNGFDLQLNNDGTVHVDFGEGVVNASSADGVIPLSTGAWHYIVNRPGFSGDSIS